MADDGSSEVVRGNVGASRADRIGAGSVILVVGPSGAGKDALLDGVRRSAQAYPVLHFAERVVSRPTHSAEAHRSARADDMARAALSGAYALTWQAHGLIYGIPASIDDHVRAGRAVVFNASRTIIEAARARYARVYVVLIDAPEDARAARLAGRGRETMEEVRQRLNRTVTSFEPGSVDYIVDNGQDLETGIRRLSKALEKIVDRSHI